MQKPRKLIQSILITIPLIFLLSQCSIGNLLPILIGRKIWLSNISIDLKNEIRRNVKAKSSITDAKWILEFNGFKCSFKKDSESANAWNVKERSKDGDYLLCSQMQSYIICAKTYTVAIYYIKGEVTDVDAATGEYCL